MKKYKVTSQNVKRQNKLGYLFLLPWLIGAVFFSLLPAILTFLMSFMEVKSSTIGYEFKIIWFTNYLSSLFGNVAFLPAVWDFLKTEIIYVPIIIVMAFIIANFLVKDIKFKAFFRTLFFLPVIIISGTLVSILFTTNIEISETVVIQNPLANTFFYRIIMTYTNMKIANSLVVLFDNFVLILWLSGIPVILLINGLQKINKEMYEAANIDGANKWQTLWKITIPNISYIAFICAVFSVVQISILPITDMYTLIENGLTHSSSQGFGLISCYAIIYVIIILLVILFFKVILVRKPKASKEVYTYTMKTQLKKTQMKMGVKIDE